MITFVPQKGMNIALMRSVVRHSSKGTEPELGYIHCLVASEISLRVRATDGFRSITTYIPAPFTYPTNLYDEALVHRHDFIQCMREGQIPGESGVTFPDIDAVERMVNDLVQLRMTIPTTELVSSIKTHWTEPKPHLTTFVFMAPSATGIHMRFFNIWTGKGPNPAHISIEDGDSDFVPFYTNVDLERTIEHLPPAEVQLGFKIFFECVNLVWLRDMLVVFNPTANVNISFCSHKITHVISSMPISGPVGISGANVYGMSTYGMIMPRYQLGEWWRIKNLLDDIHGGAL